MCWSLRAFLRYLHHRGLNPLALAGCVPSIRRWKLASLPTYLSAAQAQKILDGCDRTTALGRRDYAILMMLAKLGLRADEVATLTLDNIDWRSRRDCRGTSSSISVTSSPILCNAPPQHGQAAGPG
jgi:integrase